MISLSSKENWRSFNTMYYRCILCKCIFSDYNKAAIHVAVYHGIQPKYGNYSCIEPLNWDNSKKVNSKRHDIKNADNQLEFHLETTHRKIIRTLYWSLQETHIPIKDLSARRDLFTLLLSYMFFNSYKKYIPSIYKEKNIMGVAGYMRLSLFSLFNDILRYYYEANTGKEFTELFEILNFEFIKKPLKSYGDFIEIKVNDLLDYLIINMDKMLTRKDMLIKISGENTISPIYLIVENQALDNTENYDHLSTKGISEYLYYLGCILSTIDTKNNFWFKFWDGHFEKKYILPDKKSDKLYKYNFFDDISVKYSYKTNDKKYSTELIQKEISQNFALLLQDINKGKKIIQKDWYSFSLGLQSLKNFYEALTGKINTYNSPTFRLVVNEYLISLNEMLVLLMKRINAGVQTGSKINTYDQTLLRVGTHIKSIFYFKSQCDRKILAEEHRIKLIKNYIGEYDTNTGIIFFADNGMSASLNPLKKGAEKYKFNKSPDYHQSEIYYELHNELEKLFEENPIISTGETVIDLCSYHYGRHAQSDELQNERKEFNTIKLNLLQQLQNSKNIILFHLDITNYNEKPIFIINKLKQEFQSYVEQGKLILYVFESWNKYVQTGIDLASKGFSYIYAQKNYLEHFRIDQEDICIGMDPELIWLANSFPQRESIKNDIQKKVSLFYEQYMKNSQHNRVITCSPQSFPDFICLKLYYSQHHWEEMSKQISCRINLVSNEIAGFPFISLAMGGIGYENDYYILRFTPGYENELFYNLILPSVLEGVDKFLVNFYDKQIND